MPLPCSRDSYSGDIGCANTTRTVKLSRKRLREGIYNSRTRQQNRVRSCFEITMNRVQVNISRLQIATKCGQHSGITRRVGIPLHEETVYADGALLVQYS